MTPTPLWWRGLRSRLLVAVLLAALSAVAVATAVLGPLLLRAVEQASAADTVAAAGPRGNALTVSTTGDVKEDLGPLVASTQAAFSLVEAGPTAPLWGPLQTWTETVANVAWKERSSTATEVYSRLRIADSCEGLTVTEGTCPTVPGEALVSTKDADRGSVRVGDTLGYRLTGVIGTKYLRVIGLYDADTVTTPLTRPGEEAAGTSATTADPLVVIESQISRLPLPTLISTRVVLLRPVVLADLPLLRSSVDELGQGTLAQDLTLTIDPRFSEALDRVSGQTSAAVVMVGVVEAQALGLALFAVVIVLARVSRARGAEWGAGRLLGVPRVRWFRSVYAEPGVALLVGVPIGYAVAVGVARVAVRTGLRPGTPFEPWRWPVLLCAGGAATALLLALVAVSLPSLRRPLAELVTERSEAAATTPLAAVAQAVALLLAGFTVYVLLAGDVLGGRGPQVGLLAPALFALALAVLGIRVAVLVVRRGARRPARTLIGLVIARQAARAPSSLSPGVVVTVGVALVIFSGQVLALSVRNQELKASAVAGATTVLDLVAPRGADLIGAVDRADPSGRQAVAVRELDPPGDTGVDRIVAVDTSRLAAVAAWSPAWAGVDDVAGALRPATGVPIELRGRRVDVRLDSVVVRPIIDPNTDSVPADPTLRITVDTGSRWSTVVLGAVKDRDRLTAAIPCADGCRLVGIALGSGGLQTYTASLRITGLGTDVDPPRGTASWLTEEGRWHPRVGSYYEPDVQAYATPETGPDGLKIDFTDTSGGSDPAVAPSDVLDPLPVVVGPGTEVEPFPGLSAGTAYGTGLDGSAQLIDVVGRAQVLPRVLADGVLTDLRTAQDLVDPLLDSARAEVWLAPGAPASIERSLAADGFVVTGREELSDTTAALLREPQTRGAAVAQTVARAAVLLTLLALVAARVADAARRRLDWRSLADAGVDGRTLRRLAAAEIGVPSLLGVLLGAVGGVVAVVLSAPRLPLVDLTTPGPPLALGLDWPLVVLTTAVSLAMVLLVALVAAFLETRRVALR